MAISPAATTTATKRRERTNMAAAAAAAHVLVFPAPGQGHINCMMHFATGLVGAGLYVTFLYTDHSLRRRGALVVPRPLSPPTWLRFMSIPDSLPDDHARAMGEWRHRGAPGVAGDQWQPGEKGFMRLGQGRRDDPRRWQG
uniref:Glycosyltransferase n=1 Tax=Oryza barthii TaxID=65489 RepID=A0A0D3FAQ1_9ORYZ